MLLVWLCKSVVVSELNMATVGTFCARHVLTMVICIYQYVPTFITNFWLQRFCSFNLTDLILCDCLSLVTWFLHSAFLSFKEFDLGRFLWPGGDVERSGDCDRCRILTAPHDILRRDRLFFFITLKRQCAYVCTCACAYMWGHVCASYHWCPALISVIGLDTYHFQPPRPD